MATGTLEELAGFCRLCGKQKSRLVSVFIKDPHGVPLCSRIVDNLLIPISEDDLLPREVCIVCQKTLNQFCNFAEKCRAVQTDFNTRLAELLAKKDTPHELPCSRSFSTLENELQVESPTPRELFVCIPRLTLTSGSFSVEQQQHEKAPTNSNELDVCPGQEMEFEYSPVIQIKEEIKEEILAVESTLLSTDHPSKDDVDCKLEQKVEEQQQTSVLDIPFIQDSPSKPVTGCESHRNTSIMGQLDEETFTNNICSLKNIISNIFDSQNIIIDDKDSLLNVTFGQPKHRSLESRADMQSNFSFTLDAQQLSGLFPNVAMSDTDLKKLGAAIFYKNLPDILKTQVQISNDDLKTGELREAGTSKSVTVTFDCNKTQCNSSTEEVNTCIPLPIPCTVELVNIKPELKAVEEDLSFPKHQDVQPAEAPTFGWQVPQLEMPNRNTMNGHHLSTTGIRENYAKTSESMPRSLIPEMKVPRIVLTHLSSSSTVDIPNPEKQENGIRGPFTCQICQKSFSKEYLLTEHANGEHTESFTCDFCDATFPEQDALKTHSIAAHSKSRPYSCKTCKSDFASRFKLEKHMCSDSIDMTYNCARCTYVAKDQYRLTQHSKEVHDKRFECDICGERFGKKSKIESHLQNYHTDCKPVQCSRCNLTFTQRHYWREHLKTHSLDSSCICTYCGLKFDKKYKLSLHISKTHELKEIKCTQCSSFTTLHKYHLTQHVREVHNKKFVCHHCGKFESKKCRIVVHIRNNHTAKKKYRCTFKNCKATYNSKCWFEEHVRKHRDQ